MTLLEEEILMEFCKLRAAQTGQSAQDLFDSIQEVIAYYNSSGIIASEGLTNPPHEVKI